MSIDFIRRHIIGETTLHLNSNGWTGALSVVVPSTQMFDAPQLGDPWPFPEHNLPHLKCTSVDWVELTDFMVRIKCDYSTDSCSE